MPGTCTDRELGTYRIVRLTSVDGSSRVVVLGDSAHQALVTLAVVAASFTLAEVTALQSEVTLLDAGASCRGSVQGQTTEPFGTETA